MGAVPPQGLPGQDPSPSPEPSDGEGLLPLDPALPRLPPRQDPLALGRREVTDFLSDLAVRGRVSASTQNQALAALLVLYREVLESDLSWLDDLVRARRPRRLPVVMSREEVRSVLVAMTA